MTVQRPAASTPQSPTDVTLTRATSTLIAQKVLHLAVAGWTHVGTTTEHLSDAADHAEDAGGQGILLVFWRADALARRPTERATGDSAWIRDYPEQASMPSMPVLVTDDDPDLFDLH